MLEVHAHNEKTFIFTRSTLIPVDLAAISLSPIAYTALPKAVKLSIIQPIKNTINDI